MHPLRSVFCACFRVLFIVALVPMSLLSCSDGGFAAIEEARALVDDASEKMRLATQAQAVGDQAGANEQATASRADLRAARERYLQARADLSGDPELLSEFAALAVQTEDYDLAARAYKRAGELSPDEGIYWLEAGRNFVRVGVGMADDARESLMTCRTLAERSGDTDLAARADTQLGHLYRTLGLYDLAREQYEAGLATERQFFDARAGLAGLNFREGRVAEAAAAIEQIGALQLQSGDLEYVDAMVRFGYEGFRENRVWFEDTAANHLSYTKLLTRMQRVEEALPAAQRAVELDDQNVVALNLLGSLARAVGDDTLAIEAFKQSLRVSPDQPRTVQVLNDLESPPPSQE